jgi:hypothetical protein
MWVPLVDLVGRGLEMILLKLFKTGTANRMECGVRLAFENRAVEQAFQCELFRSLLSVYHICYPQYL